MSKYPLRPYELPKLPRALAPATSGLVSVESELVLVRERLHPDDLIALMENRIIAIRIKKYYDPDKCQELADRLLGSPRYGKYVNAPAIGRVGQAYFECQADEESRRR